jgi:hypothetical protein
MIRVKWKQLTGTFNHDVGRWWDGRGRGTCSLQHRFPFHPSSFHYLDTTAWIWMWNVSVWREGGGGVARLVSKTHTDVLLYRPYHEIKTGPYKIWIQFVLHIWPGSRPQHASPRVKHSTSSIRCIYPWVQMQWNLATIIIHKLLAVLHALTWLKNTL